MKKLNIIYAISIISVALSLNGCTKSIGEDYQKYISADVNSLSGLLEKFNLTSVESKQNYEGVDRDYKDLNGCMEVMNLYSVEGTDITILYNSKFDNGDVRVILVKPDGKVTDIVKNNGDGSINDKIPPGKSVIKIIGVKATGNLKINVTLTSNEEISKLGKFDKDGEYMFPLKKQVKGNYFSAKFYRVNVLNNKIDKLAKIDINGQIIDGTVTTKFSDDGWGNSGVVKATVQSNSIENIDIKIDNKNFQSTSWGIKEGNFSPSGGDLPDILKGLN
ncbi:hypothetical protein [Clostridium sp. 'White wine YQ']|uniref:hypothetical protein n=1 Tax=Clostridium sp. 'White wine YQ' TaxID=3027474 RepID=UPI0023672D9D|nr:hypothetical protein [Clostridium sp. 'White wine YQ']MDD7796036.1 hypothetical protein [Clostridium sp. 'White wine YQ']